MTFFCFPIKHSTHTQSLFPTLSIRARGWLWFRLRTRFFPTVDYPMNQVTRERVRVLLGTTVHNGGSRTAPAARTPHHHALSCFPAYTVGSILPMGMHRKIILRWNRGTFFRFAQTSGDRGTRLLDDRWFLFLNGL